MSKKSRRQFLQDIGALTSGTAFLRSPLGQMISAIAGSALTTSLARAAGVVPRRYINIQQGGAPPRWMFDHMLNAYGTTDTLTLDRNQFGTRYVANGGRYVDVEYRTVPINGIQVPWIWGQSVPKAGGGTRPMSELLNNSCFIQGISTGNPGHLGSMALHFRPAGATRSLGALSADYSNAYIPAVNLMAGEFIFASLVGKSAVPVGPGGNLLQKLLTPFLSKASVKFQALKNDTDVKLALESARTSLDSAMLSEHLSSNVLIESQKNAEQLINGGFGDLAVIWPSLFDKYQTLINRTITAEVKGINDLPIGSTNVDARLGDYHLDSQVVKFADLRELLTSGTLNISGLAEQFALAEFVLLNNLSYSITMAPGSLINFKTETGKNTVTSHNTDEHYTGKMPSLLINTLKQMANVACMLELIDQLKTKNIWQETVIDMGGEFNRSARMDGSGSDHGYQGKSLALYSGGFKGSVVIGNVPANTGVYAWGPGAINATLGRSVQLNDMAATIAYLLRTPSPITSASSLVTINPSTQLISSVVEKARRV